MTETDAIRDRFPNCPSLESLYRTGKATDIEGRPINATGLSSINNLLALEHLVRSEKPIKTLEVGLAYGGSALAILSTLESVHPTGNFFHTAVDPGQDSFKNAGINMVNLAGFSQSFHCIEESSDVALPALAAKNEKFDMIYIDGYHIFENVFIDAYYSLKLLNEGGIVVFDDCFDPHVGKVIRFMETNMQNYAEKIRIKVEGAKKPLIKRLANRFGYAQIKGYRKTENLPRTWNAAFSRF